MKYLTFLLTIISFFNSTIHSQSILKPYFDSEEYKNALLINASNMDTSVLLKRNIPFPKAKIILRSQVTGMENRWDYWVDNRGVGIISLRGTTPQIDSWLENFYAAMVPAIGEIKFKDRIFKYKLSKDSAAFVHIGWLLGLSSMAEDIVKTINHYHKTGTNDFIIVGHSQGGALAILLRAYLYYLEKPLDNNIRIKVYASAAPKVGNLNFCYNFDFITRGGWAMRIVNNLDWVPQIPFSIQRISDISNPNPFGNINNKVSQIPWYAKIYVKKTYRKMDNKTIKAQEYYTKILGKKVESFVENSVSNYNAMEYSKSFNYVACGLPIILYSTDNYINNFLPGRKEDGVFINHSFLAYLYLLKQNYPERD